MLVLAAILLLLAGGQTLRIRSRLLLASRTEGTVTHGGSHPVIAFRPSAGDTATFTQNGFYTADTGEKMDVLYDPADPAGTAVVDRLLPVWWPSVWLGLPGAILLALSLLGARAAAAWRYERSF